MSGYVRVCDEDQEWRDKLDRLLTAIDNLPEACRDGNLDPVEVKDTIKKVWYGL